MVTLRVRPNGLGSTTMPVTAEPAIGALSLRRALPQVSGEVPSGVTTGPVVRTANLEGSSPLDAGARAATGFQPMHFPSSEFGLVHADRSANDAYSLWSAQAATRISAGIVAGQPIRELFAMARDARRAFARDVEKVPDAEVEGFGGARSVISPYPYGEDYIGITSTNMRGMPATVAIEHDLGGHKPFWKVIGALPQRTAIADEALARAMRDLGTARAERTCLIVDRHYPTLSGEVLKVASTQFDQARAGDPASPYLVRTWNAPKPEIDAVIADVHARADRVLRTGDQDELAIAMYGFFNAMPYYRGSGAIGRIVFGAIASHIAGKPVALPADLDVQAIISTLPQFVSWFRAA